MKITLEIQDDHLNSFLELMRNLKFVKLAKEPVVTHYASVKVLCRDWLSKEEDEVWKAL